MTYKFRKIAKFKYKDKKFQLFMDKFNRLAFLEIDENNKYHYPTLEDLFRLTTIFAKNNKNLAIRDNRINYYNFIPKLKYAGTLLTITTLLLTGCANSKYIDSLFPQNIPYEQDENNYESDFEFNTEYQNQTNENNIVDEESLKAEYITLLAPADDEYDFKYASDFVEYKLIDYIYIRDSQAYQHVFGYSNISIEDIKSALNKNNNISQKYKDFIEQYVKDWLELYPGTDFSILYTNLSTLKIKEISKEDMLWETLAFDAVAAYKREENTIYVLKGINLDRNSDDYIIFVHELSHAARGTKFINEDGDIVRASFYDDMMMGYYSEEALITNFAYQLQNLNNKSNFYTLQSSYFRIILDCIDYDGADFMNHSVNYLIEKMDEYMGDEEYAYHIISLIDAEATLRYTDYIEVDYHEFSELYEYITKMYMKKNLNENMSYDEALVIYDNLMSEITYYFDKMKNPYDIDYSVFENTFNECLSELNISKGLKRG